MQTMNQARLNTDLVSDARDQLIQDLRNLSTHAQELVQATSLLTEDAVALARGRLEESLLSAREQLARLPESLEQRSRTALGEFEAQATAHPRESVAAVALTSLALGWLSRGAASGLINNLARTTAIGVAGLAGSVLWSYRQRSLSAQEPLQSEEVGRWESEGGSAPGTDPAASPA
jgi:ElaB/YqjD/DUF883 family membrane-anchored ribosome-binding protein